MPRVVASIEARMGSSRLPGKALAAVAGVPALTRMIRRLRRCRLLDKIVLATSTAHADDVLYEWAGREDVPVYRGSEDDVLRRVVEAHRMAASELVVEMTGDCVLMDPEIVDMCITTFLENDCDVVCNCIRQRSYPLGMDVQVFRAKDLEEIDQTVDDADVREHVSLEFYRHPERYRILHLFAPARWSAPEFRLELDYPEDLTFVNEIYRRLEPQHGDDFGLEEIMSLLRREPTLVDINRHCVEKGHQWALR